MDGWADERTDIAYSRVVRTHLKIHNENGSTHSLNQAHPAHGAPCFFRFLCPASNPHQTCIKSAGPRRPPFQQISIGTQLGATRRPKTTLLHARRTSPINLGNRCFFCFFSFFFFAFLLSQRRIRTSASGCYVEDGWPNWCSGNINWLLTNLLFWLS